MKHLSLFEKQLIRQLIDVDKTGGLNVLGNMMDFYLYPNIYINLSSETHCYAMITESYFNQIATQYGNMTVNLIIKELEENLLLSISLLRYLEKENYIHIVGSVGLNTLGPVDHAAQYISHSLNDPDLESGLFTLSKKKIVVEESLKKFYANGYKTDDDLAKEKSNEVNNELLKWTSRGVVVAGASALLSLCFQIYDTLKTEDNEIKITQPIKVLFEDSLNVISEPIDTIYVNYPPKKGIRH